MGFDPQTELRLRELFGGRRCCRCGRPAARLARDRFFCERHFRAGKPCPGGNTGPTADRGNAPKPTAPGAETPVTDA